MSLVSDVGQISEIGKQRKFDLRTWMKGASWKIQWWMEAHIGNCHREVGWKHVECIQLVPVSAQLNFRAFRMVRNILTSWGIIRFSSRILLYGVSLWSSYLRKISTVLLILWHDWKPEWWCRSVRPLLGNDTLTHVSLGTYPTQRIGCYGINIRSRDND
jgi:hypothetical protein